MLVVQTVEIKLGVYSQVNARDTRDAITWQSDPNALPMDNAIGPVHKKRHDSITG